MSSNLVRANRPLLEASERELHQAGMSVYNAWMRLNEALVPLRRGAWVGSSADAFYAELTVVLAQIIRLNETLRLGGGTIRNIMQLMDRAEDDAARMLRLAGDDARLIEGDFPIGWPSHIDRSKDIGKPREAQLSALQFLAEKFGFAQEEMRVVSIDAAMFRSSGMGIEEPGQAYLSVMRPGYIIRISAGGKVYQVHTGPAGGAKLNPNV
jgi:uncharacterized protein YukE